MSTTCPRCGRTLAKDVHFCPFDGAALDPEVASFDPLATQRNGTILLRRYQIAGYVSKGATARVYLARDLERPASERESVVAVKLFSPAVQERAAMRRRFLEEARALRAIDHPNVVRVLDAGESDDGLPFVVMEALRGKTLGDILGRAGTLDLETALRLARETGEGLEATHRAGVVHRDVKPDNLFLVDVPGAERPRVKLIDFGMAKLEATSSSSQDFVMGTMQYMAPEQIVSEPVDARTDVYALGVVLFRMITGHLPFDGELATDLLAHQLFSPAPPPSWLDDDLDPDVERVILSAMRKNPDNRYPSMRAFLDDLARERPLGHPLLHEPDVYTPSTPRGREAAQFLSSQFGGAR